MNILDSTPIEKYQVDGFPIFVKREDLCVPPPSPPFSKMRGLIAHLKKLKSEGINKVAYVETSISMAGWGIAWACEKLNLEAVIFEPQYKDRNELSEPLKLLQKHKEKWLEHGAKLIPLPAHMASVNYYRARRWIQDNDPNLHLLPLGIPLEETIVETAEVASQSYSGFKNIVVNVGSGTICAGILRGLSSHEVFLWGIMGRSGNRSEKYRSVFKKSGLLHGSLISYPVHLKIVDPGYGYTEMESRVEAPFPCHPFYDLKAWKWLVDNLDLLKPPVLFWNIGSCPFDLG